MKKMLSISLLILLFIFIYTHIQSEDASFEAKIEQSNASFIDGEPSSSRGAASINDLISEPLPSAKSGEKADSAEVTPKITYEGEWCISSIDLNEEDYAFAQTELQDWTAERGEIWKNGIDFHGNYSEYKNADLLEPYNQMTSVDLLTLVSQDDLYAMITALQREDIDWDLKSKLANRLLVLGDTSMSLMHLISREMAYARVAYEDQKKVTPKIKKNIIKALSYLTYGMNRLDSSALFHYVTMIDDDEILGRDLLPHHVLSSKDFEKVVANAKSIERQVDEQRSKENKSPLDEIDIPKIAFHAFEERVAFLYLHYENAIETVSRLPLETPLPITKTECVNRYLKLFNSEPK